MAHAHAQILHRLLESAFDTAYSKWSAEADKDEVEKTIDQFKILKSRNFIQGREADISPWIAGSFAAFQQFVAKKEAQHEQKTAIRRSADDADKIFQNEFVTIISPNTFEASQKYGANTKWCISGHVATHWDSYAKRGIKFYFILPRSGTGKLAVTVHPGGASVEVYNEADKVIPDAEFNQLLKTYQIPEEVVKAMHTNDIDWEAWLSKHEHTRHPDGSVSIKGDVNLSRMGLTRLPFRFSQVGGNFNCYGNQLTSLEDAPSSVSGDFFCNDNQLTSLAGCPSSVGGNFFCSSNQLTSLEGAPSSVGGNFYCYGNQLTSLEGAPSSVGGDFDCQSNQVKLKKPAWLKIKGTFYN